MHMVTYILFPCTQIQQLETNEQWTSQISANDHDVLSLCGIQFGKLEHKNEIVEAIVKHSCIFSVKAELDQLREGMELFHMPKIFKRYSALFRPLFIHSILRLTAESMQDMFTIEFSPVGSNRRDNEENVAMHWVSLLEEAGEGLLLNNEEDDNFTVTLEDILFFATGGRQLPPMGFFQQDQYPRASTCANILELPLIDTYAEFRAAMCYAICNTVGFGFLYCLYIADISSILL